MLYTETGNWSGARQRRFRWLRLRFEYGRYHYSVNGLGDTIAQRWRWERP